MKGGTLVFNMTDSPSDWGTDDKYIPKTEIKDKLNYTSSIY